MLLNHTAQRGCYESSLKVRSTQKEHSRGKDTVRPGSHQCQIFADSIGGFALPGNSRVSLLETAFEAASEQGFRK